MNPFILLSAAAAGGFYLLNVPLIAALAAGAGGVGWSFGAFVPAGAVRRAERKAAGIGKKPKKRVRPHPPLRTMFAPAKYLLRHTELLLLSVSGVLSTGDAMRTALAVGALNTLAAIRISPARLRASKPKPPSPFPSGARWPPQLCGRASF